MSFGKSHPFFELVEHTDRSVVMQSRIKNDAEHPGEEVQATFSAPYKSFEFTQSQEVDCSRPRPILSAFVVAADDWLQSKSKQAIKAGVAEAFSLSCDKGGQQFTYSVYGARHPRHKATCSEPFVSRAISRPAVQSTSSDINVAFCAFEAFVV